MTAQQLVRENVQYLIQQLEAGHSEALTGFSTCDGGCSGTTHCHQSAFYCATKAGRFPFVAGMYAWNQLGRFVNKGEKGIAILAPLVAKPRKDEAKGTDETSNGRPALFGFRKVYVWDEAQTEGAPLPQLEKVTGEAGVYLDRLREYVIAQGITLEFDESIAPALGMAGGTTIRILPGQTQPEEFSTLVHELAHLMLKHGARRTETTTTVRETEAEAIAFVVGKSIGLTTSTASADYIDLYHGNAALLTESLELVQQTSAIILAALRTEGAVSQEVSETMEARPEAKRVGGSSNQTAATEEAAD